MRYLLLPVILFLYSCTTSTNYTPPKNPPKKVNLTVEEISSLNHFIEHEITGFKYNGEQIHITADVKFVTTDTSGGVRIEFLRFSDKENLHVFDSGSLSEGDVATATISGSRMPADSSKVFSIIRWGFLSPEYTLPNSSLGYVEVLDISANQIQY